MREEFDLMVDKGQWVVFTYSVDKELPGVEAEPAGRKGGAEPAAALVRQL